jgi:hypothetical protein
LLPRINIFITILLCKQGSDNYIIKAYVWAEIHKINTFLPI